MVLSMPVSYTHLATGSSKELNTESIEEPVAPVSYTHLDVYKRQECAQESGSRLAPAVLVRQFFEIFLQREVCPVSYTHLSVTSST